MLRRLAISATLFGFGLLVSTSWAQGDAARCNPDSIGTTSHGAGWDVSGTASTVPASTVTTESGKNSNKHKTALAAADGKTAESSSPVDGGGASATGSGEDINGNIGDSGVRKRGLRWQSFLPGVIK